MRQTCAPLPAPTVAADALPGFALSQAISSFASFGGSAFLPMIISGVALISDTGRISKSASCATGYIAPDPTWLVQLPMLIVVPSGAACAARPTPMLAPAPVTFSITTGWPSDIRMRSERMRASVSVGPPAGNGTIMVTGRDEGWALAPQLAVRATAAATAAIFMFPPGDGADDDMGCIGAKSQQCCPSTHWRALHGNVE